MNLQLFAAKDPEEQVNEYIKRLEKIHVTGIIDDKRLLDYTRENVNKALFYFKRYLSKGIEAPDGFTVNITKKDFYKQLTDPVILLKPQYIDEIIRNSFIKIRKADGRFIYLSRKPYGIAVVKDICFSVHYWGANNERRVQQELTKELSKGGIILWEKN